MSLVSVGIVALVLHTPTAESSGRASIDTFAAEVDEACRCTTEACLAGVDAEMRATSRREGRVHYDQDDADRASVLFNRLDTCAARITGR